MEDATILNIGGIDYRIVDASVPSWAKAENKPSYTANEISGLATVATSGSYNDLTDKPNIPTSADINAAKPLVVTLTGTESNGNITYNATETFATIKAAYLANREVFVVAPSDSQSGDGVTMRLMSYGNDITEILTFSSTVKLWGSIVLLQATCDNLDHWGFSATVIPPVDSSITGSDQTNPVQGGAIYNALLGKQNKSIEMYATYETLLSALTGTSYENPVTLTGTALEQYNDLVNKYTDGNYSFLFLGTPLVTDSESWGNIGAMMFNILYGGNSITDSTSSFTINKQGDNYWVENTSRSIQAQLVSGTNIKTINNQSLLGSGNLTANDIGAATISDVDDAIRALPTPMVFQGTIGTGGTSTTVPSNPTEGDTYKIISGGQSLTFSGITAGTIKVGDTVIYKNSTVGWILIPSGDEPSGTVTSVGMTVPTGLKVSGSPITSSGTLAVTYDSGYSIPPTADQESWNNKANVVFIQRVGNNWREVTYSDISHDWIVIGNSAPTGNPKNIYIEVLGGDAYYYDQKFSSFVRIDEDPTTITNDLNATVSGTALDATQGKILKDMIDAKQNAIEIIDLT